jgi:hypothetical protein
VGKEKEREDELNDYYSSNKPTRMGIGMGSGEVYSRSGLVNGLGNGGLGAGLSSFVMAGSSSGHDSTSSASSRGGLGLGASTSASSSDHDSTSSRGGLGLGASTSAGVGGGATPRLVVGLFCYIFIFYYLYVDSLTYVLGWSAFLCRIGFCDTLVVIFLK